jgi:hypothetical protein
MLRILISMVVATAFVLTMTALGVRWFYEPEREGEATYRLIERIELIGGDDPKLAERRRERQREFVREGAREREAPPPPVVERPEREVRGFVQVEFTVLPDGSIENFEVVGAHPEGVYEDRARARVEARDYAGTVSPIETDGRRISEVVQFSVPASEVHGRD